MPVVQVREMPMAMHKLAVLMRMNVRLVWRVFLRMGMLVMSVVHMGVLVLQGLVGMLMLMPLREVKPEAKPHQEGGDGQPGGHRLAE